MLNWDDLNYFLTLSRTGKLNLASKKLNVESTTISRRVIRLEKKHTHLIDNVMKRLTFMTWKHF